MSHNELTSGTHLCTLYSYPVVIVGEFDFEPYRLENLNTSKVTIKAMASRESEFGDPLASAFGPTW